MKQDRETEGGRKERKKKKQKKRTRRNKGSWIERKIEASKKEHLAREGISGEKGVGVGVRLGVIAPAHPSATIL